MTESYARKLAAILLDAVTDKDPVVQEQVCSALCALGEAQPEEALSACEEYLWQHEKVSRENRRHQQSAWVLGSPSRTFLNGFSAQLAHPYRTMILRAMETVVSGHIGELDKDMARAIILLASSEMTRVKELVCDWQQAASSVLVAVGKRFIGKVMEELLSKFQPGALPHYFVVQTLANLAASNVFGMVPFLTSILSTMLPMLGMAKHDTMRAVFCCALQYFSESTLEYLANLDQAPDPTVRKDTFATDIFSAYDILFNHWLQSREAKLRLAVVEALGPMSHLLPSEKLEEQLPKLLPGVLALFKKHAETFHVSKSLGQILEAAVSVGSRTLEPQLDSLLAALHAQICVPVESSSPLVVSNQKEVLRCFTVLACCAPDRLLAFLLPKLDASNERTRVGTLQVVRHVINSAASQMEVKKPFILSSMRLPLLDTNTKVKRAVVQVISAMAHHGYLEQPGGEAMVEYIVQQCALPPETEPQKLGPDSEDLPADGVRAISISTLYLVSTTVDRMSDVLWPYLLEFLTPVRFTGALTPLCKSLVHLAQKRQEVGADAFLIQYDGNVTLPSPYAITTRLLTVSSNPYLGDGRGAASLRLLNVLHRGIHPALGPRWATTIPLLLEHLDERTEESLSQKEWEEKLLAFLRDTLAVVSDNTWICQLSLEMCKQLPCYNGIPQEKNFLYKCIGTALGAASSKEVVRKQLQELLETARHHEEAEREGLACCFGICAISHLDDVLAQLEDFMRSDVFRKSIGIFNIFKDRSENEVEKLKCTLILCYGHVAAQAPRELVLAKVESDILRNIFQYFSTKVLGIKVETKDPALKLCLVQSVCMASQAICSSAQAGSFHFSRKAELVAQMISLYLDTMHALEDLLTSLLRRNMTPQGLQVMVEIIAKRLPPEQLISLLLTMFEGLGDPDKNCSRAATVMINCLLKERGNVLLEKVPEIVSVLRTKLQQTREEYVLQAAQHSVYLLASQHCAAVVSSLLGSPLPFDSHTCTLWRALAVEPGLTAQVLGLLLEKMSRDVPFKETRAFLLSSSPGRVATVLPLAATCALYEVMSALASGPAVLELYPQLFAALLLRISCTVGVLLPRTLQAKEKRGAGSALAPRSLEPCSSAVDALQAMLLRGGNEDVVQRLELEGGWQLLRTSAGHEEGVARLASAMAKFAGPRLPLVMKELVCTHSSVYEIQRVTSTGFLAELLTSNVVNDLMLLESLLDNLAARQKDPCASVRRLVLRGLANMASGSPDKVRAHGPQLLTAVIGGLDDTDDPHSLVALEAMVGLARLLDLVEPQDLRPVLLHVAIRIRPFFDSEKMELRSASIRLFGHLNKACHGGCEDMFLEQVVGGLVPLLLHLRDPQAPVTSACRFALCMSGPNLECAELQAALQKHLQEGRGLHFGEFLNSTCKLLVRAWAGPPPLTLLLPTGFLVLHVEAEHRPQVDLEQLTAALQLLLKDPAPLVRMKAAETLGRLVKFA
ncbi:maestro heat-like repeat-containing protein family member 1 isoform X9 [Ailuropoda melanoleuca]|uniref:maestro heat-like repeat-containing protein family member 1 isoform X9 n=1 Tax=Ailuropoda melanoleuca TaxID=9646 RepID=UPI001494BC34|nr:maestro heat-like repeat-containing protein family member 1 isoform X9 [Ailuropoda melanoleuca]